MKLRHVRPVSGLRHGFCSHGLFVAPLLLASLLFAAPGLVTAQSVAVVAAAKPVPATAAAANAVAPAATASTCPAGGSQLLLGALPRLAARLASDQPVRIVAIGSSSTAGAGASDATHSYPRQLENRLQARYGGARVTVLNAGVGGQEVADMLARLDTDVLAHRPDLVIWQFAANGLLRDVPMTAMEADARAGIARIRASGAEVVLMDLQHVPRIDAKAERDDVLAMMKRIARSTDSALFNRYQLMQAWDKAMGAQYEPVMVHADRLHLTDTSYRCLAEALSTALHTPSAWPAEAPAPALDTLARATPVTTRTSLPATAAARP